MENETPKLYIYNERESKVRALKHVMINVSSINFAADAHCHTLHSSSSPPFTNASLLPFYIFIRPFSAAAAKTKRRETLWLMEVAGLFGCHDIILPLDPYWAVMAYGDAYLLSRRSPTDYVWKLLLLEFLQAHQTRSHFRASTVGVHTLATPENEIKH